MRKIVHSELTRAGVFGLLSVVFALLFVFGLVNNSNGSVERYNKLIAVDKAGGDVETALNDLRSYIYSHMNTEVGGPNGIYPPIQLKATYERLIASEEERVSKTNEALSGEALKFCEENGPSGFSGGNRVDCVEEYIDKNGTDVQSIDKELYQFNFVAPRWSADLAGFSLLALILSGTATVFNLFMYWRTKHFVHIGN